MARGKKPAAKDHGNGANLGFEPTLWAAAEYKRVVLGLIFLKYISDAFKERHERILAGNPPGGMSFG